MDCIGLSPFSIDAMSARKGGAAIFLALAMVVGHAHADPLIMARAAGEDGWLYVLFTDGNVRGFSDRQAVHIDRGEFYELVPAAGGIVMLRKDGVTYARQGKGVRLGVPGPAVEAIPAPGGVYLHIFRERDRVSLWHFNGTDLHRVYQ